jgi:glycosyltransferase involved in cell wall biosynthesis
LLLQLKSFLESRGHTISVVVGEDSDSALIPEYQVVPRTASPGDRLRLYLQWVQRTKPDLVYTISGTEESNLLRFLCVPRVLHVSSLEQHEYLDVPFRLRQLQAYTEGRTANTPDVLTRICPANGGVLQGFTAPYLLNPCFVASPDTNCGTDSSETHPISVCFVGRLETFQKRVHWLPQIIKKCRRPDRNLEWHIYGSGPWERRFCEALKENGCTEGVRFHGWLEAEGLAKRLAKADLFFLCSRWEGLPIAMAEAMLCGLACVVPAIPAGITHVLRTGGGWLYDATSAASCAAALLEATEDRAIIQRKKLEAQQIAREMFSRKTVEEQLSRLETGLKTLSFNGNVLEVENAPKMRAVRAPVWIKRQLLALIRRVRKKF